MKNVTFYIFIFKWYLIFEHGDTFIFLPQGRGSH